jgi:3-dehydroquinate dehydratase
MICIPIKEKKAASLTANIKKAQKEADIVEVWFDDVKILSTECAKLFTYNKKPFIYKVTSGKNLEILKSFKVEFVDIDYKTTKKEIKKIKEFFPKSKVIVSYHDFKKTPSQKNYNRFS